MKHEPIFYSAIGHRPIRLSTTTRQLAARALSGEIGRSMVDLPLELDGIDEFDRISEVKKYSCAIRLIAQNAPLRHITGEKLVGAATLVQGRCHNIPAYYKGKPVYMGVSHLTCGFDQVMKIGLEGLRKQIEHRLSNHTLDQKAADLLHAMISCLDSFQIWHQRYVELISERIASSSGENLNQYIALMDNFKNVPFHPPESFREAVQSLWFMFAFLRLCGNWPGIGRLDFMLGPYLKRDLREGKITLEEARELLAHFWIKGCEWITMEDSESGDAQHYQNIVLGGIDENGNEITNEVTYLILDIVEELGISDFPIAVRVSRNTQENLIRRIAEVQRHGGGIVAVYNEDLIIDSMLNFGYQLSEARNFANDGCWEVQVPGKTCFGYHPFDMFAILQSKVLCVTDKDASIPDYTTFDQLYEAYRTELRKYITAVHDNIDGAFLNGIPAVLIALFTDNCIEKAMDYHDRGARYTVLSPHAGGLPDTANSLLAIKHLVYDKQCITLLELVKCLRNNWQGNEVLRRYISNALDYFGNDNAEADTIAKRVYDDYVAAVLEIPARNGVLRPPGISTFGRQIDWRWNRGATADGHFAGEILSGNLSPTPGSDKKGATAIIKSHCFLGLSNLTCGTALDIRLLPATVQDEKGIETLIALIKGFIILGGFFMQSDVLDNDILLEAQMHPEKYENLAVRVSGWSARFVTLNKEWQDMIITRTAQKG